MPWHSPDVVKITEDESLVKPETARDNVFGIFTSELLSLFGFEFLLEQILLVVCDLIRRRADRDIYVHWLTCQLDDKRHVEHVL